MANDFEEQPANVTRVGLFNDLTMKTRMKRKLADKIYFNSLRASAVAFDEIRCSFSVQEQDSHVDSHVDSHIDSICVSPDVPESC